MVLSFSCLISWFMLNVYHHVCDWLSPTPFPAQSSIGSSFSVSSLNSLLVPLFSSQVLVCCLFPGPVFPPGFTCFCCLRVYWCVLFFFFWCVLSLVFCLWITPVLLQAFSLGFCLGFWTLCALIFQKNWHRMKKDLWTRARGEHMLQYTGRN